MSWYESPRHTRSHTSMYYTRPQDVLWGFEPNCVGDHSDCRIEFIRVREDSREYQMALECSGIEIAIENLEFP